MIKRLTGLLALFWIVILVSPVTGNAPLFPPVDAADPLVAAMIGQVESADLVDRLNRLTGEQPVLIGGQPYTILTRHTRSGEPIEKTTQYAFEQLEAAGLSVSYHPWSFTTGSTTTTGRNVIGDLPGLTEPERILIFSAHIDNMPASGRAPGADDNASGSVALLRSAEILGRYDWHCTLRFALWTGEEQGLLGSRVYAGEAAAANLQIAGVLNLDMIAWSSQPQPVIDLHARSSVPGSVAMANLFASVVTAYELPLVPDVLVDNWLGNYSDNRAFWDHNYAAILAIEDYSDFNPWYHTANDTVSRINPAYYTAFVQASLATFVHMSDCLVRDAGTLAGAVRHAHSGEPVPFAVLSIRAVKERAPALVISADAAGLYSQNLPAGDYLVQASAEGFVDSSPTLVTITTEQTTIHQIDLLPNNPTRVGLHRTATPTAAPWWLPVAGLLLLLTLASMALHRHRAALIDRAG
jgi:hypothetical protein